MNREELSFKTTKELSNFLDKNYFTKVRDFDNNQTINYIMSNNLYRLNPNFQHQLQIFFNENSIKQFTIEREQCSFKFNKYLINLYFIDQEFFKTKKEYMDYNCGLLLNNILGIFNLKYNFTGIYYFYKTNNKLISKYHDMYLTKNQEKIITLLNLDYSKYKHGFKDESELFKWLVSTPYLDTNKVLKNTKFKNKIFIQFKKYIQNSGIKNNPDYSESILDDILKNHLNLTDEIYKFKKNINFMALK